MRSDRLRSLGEMAAGIAHELNQPLAGISGIAEILLMQSEQQRSLEPAKTAERLQVILEQIDRMVHIIDHVRRFAREAGLRETQIVDLNRIVRSSLHLVKTQLQSRGIRLVLQTAPNPLPVRVNPFSLEEVLLNLLTNARDALEERMAAEKDLFLPRIVLSTREERSGARDRVELNIRDNGNGIPEKHMFRIFDPFFTTKDPDRGTGLGLSISKSIIEECDGHIAFVSAEGEGTEFTISLPKDPSDQGTEPDGEADAQKNPDC